MNENYAHQEAKSSESLEKEFRQLFEIVLGVLPKTIAPEVIEIYVRTFDRVGFQFGVKGLKYFIATDLGTLPTISKLAELGGRPLHQPSLAKDLPDMIVARILKGIAKDCRSMKPIYRFAGQIGVDIIQSVGGPMQFNYSCNNESLHSLQVKNLRKQAEIYLKSHSDHPEIEKILRGDEVLHDVDIESPKRLTSGEAKDKKPFNQADPAWVSMLRELGIQPSVDRRKDERQCDKTEKV